MDFFSQTYKNLTGPAGVQQTPSDTIKRLSDRLSPATLLPDRRAAVLALKGLSRDCKAEVGESALPGLLVILENDAEIDADIGKAVLETLNVLCEVGEHGDKELGLKHTEMVLANEQAVHKLFSLIAADGNFYIRFPTLQLLSNLLQRRRQLVQTHFLTAPSGPSGLMASLEDRREMVRNEALDVIQSLIAQNPDIQKLLTFEGAFDKLYNIIKSDGGIEGGAVVQECLSCCEALLRFNTANQTFFRETGLASFLCVLLLWPPLLPPSEPAPQQFALQFWDPQKTMNTRTVISILGMLVSSKGNNEMETHSFIRCLVEIALASNAPTELKTLALDKLPTNLSFPLSSHPLTPYVPVPDTNGEEWDRLEATSALEVLIDLVIQGEYAGVGAEKPFSQDALRLRTSGISVFENYVRKEDTRLGILQDMVSPEDPAPPRFQSLLLSLCLTPSHPLNYISTLSTQFATMLFSVLMHNSPRCKEFARSINPSVSAKDPAAASGAFFVPADGSAPPPPPPDMDDDDSPQSLLQLLTEHLSLCYLSRSRMADSDIDRLHWDQLIIAYVSLLCQWLWEDAQAVRGFLESGGINVIVEPITLTSDVDPVVQGLCAFLLGICYEYNREPGEITRASIHSILTRLGIDALIGRLARVKDDRRFKMIGPEDVVMQPAQAPLSREAAIGSHDQMEVWLSWAFVDFWRSNCYTIQRAIGLDPDTLSSSAGPNVEAVMLAASLREVIQNQAQQIESLRSQSKQYERAWENEVATLKSQVDDLTAELNAMRIKKEEVEKEQEDLLVLLDEVNEKRSADKIRMKDAGLEVSDDEDNDDEEEE